MPGAHSCGLVAILRDVGGRRSVAPTDEAGHLSDALATIVRITAFARTAMTATIPRWLRRAVDQIAFAPEADMPLRLPLHTATG